MKTMKLSFVAIALLAIVSAFAPAKFDPCPSVTLYSEVSEGTFEIIDNPSQQLCNGEVVESCKYYRIGDVFFPCDEETQKWTGSTTPIE